MNYKKQLLTASLILNLLSVSSALAMEDSINKTTTPANVNIEELPPEVLDAIFSFLDAKSFTSAALVSSKFNSVLQEGTICRMSIPRFISQRICSFGNSILNSIGENKLRRLAEKLVALPMTAGSLSSSDLSMVLIGRAKANYYLFLEKNEESYKEEFLNIYNKNPTIQGQLKELKEVLE